jgi:Monooxygenase af470-like
MEINRGRWTATHDGELVVFLIGMRINRPWKLHKWWPVFTAMPRMLKWLQQNPQAGLLHYEQMLASPLSPIIVQYWRSFEDLERFARAPDAPHLEAWKDFNRAVRDSGDVGIWHETYRVAPGAIETLYGNMPARGLARAGRLAPVGTTAATAAKRIGAREADEPPVEAY